MLHTIVVIEGKCTGVQTSPCAKEVETLRPGQILRPECPGLWKRRVSISKSVWGLECQKLVWVLSTLHASVLEERPRHAYRDSEYIAVYSYYLPC
jgi:hypothetical protein